MACPAVDFELPVCVVLLGRLHRVLVSVSVGGCLLRDAARLCGTCGSPGTGCGPHAAERILAGAPTCTSGGGACTAPGPRDETVASGRVSSRAWAAGRRRTIFGVPRVALP